MFHKLKKMKQLLLSFILILYFFTIDKLDAQDISKDSILIDNGFQKVPLNRNGTALQYVSVENEILVTQNELGKILLGKLNGISVLSDGGNPYFQNIFLARNGTNDFDIILPLFVVDGMVDVSANLISLNEIESITIIRDASAVALYGHQARNGVFIIKTKSGVAKNKIKVDVSSAFSVDWVSRKYDLLNADEYRRISDRYNLNYPDYLTGTDWQDELLRAGVSQKHNFAISGHLKNTTYRLAANRSSTNGAFLNNNRINNNISLKLARHLLNNRLTISAYANAFSNSDKLPHEDILFLMLVSNPTDSVYKPNSSEYAIQKTNWAFQNPLAINEFNKYNFYEKGIIGNLLINFEIFSGLKLKLPFTVKRFSELRKHEFPKSLQKPYQNLQYTESNYKHIGYQFAPTISYNKTFDMGHELSAFANFIFSTDSTYQYDKVQLSQINSYENSYETVQLKSFSSSFSYTYNNLITFTGMYNRYKNLIYFSDSVANNFAVSAVLNIKKAFLPNNTFFQQVLLTSSLGKAGDYYSQTGKFYVKNSMKDINIGLKSRYMKNSIRTSLMWFSKHINRLTASSELPIVTQGLEFEVDFDIVKNKSLVWNSSFIANNYKSIMYKKNSSGEYIYDREAFQYHLRESAGINAQGEYIYYDSKGAITTEYDLARYNYVGSPLPKWELYWNNSLSIGKNLELRMLASSVLKHKILNLTSAYLTHVWYPGVNLLTDVEKNLEFGIREFPGKSDLFLEDASYFRIERIDVTYRFNIKEIKLSFIGFAGNVLTFTKYKGQNPDVLMFITEDSFNRYPKTVTIGAGIRLNY